MAGDRSPALVVDAAVAEHLEVLGLAAIGLVFAVERVRHAHALDRMLIDAVDGGRVRKPCGLEHGRGDVDHMVEVRAELASGGEPSCQCTIVPLRVPPQCEATCFVHW